MRAAIALLLSLAFVALCIAGCRPAVGSAMPRYAPFTCEPEHGDVVCVGCLKQHCCEEYRQCTYKGHGCLCSAKCIEEGNAPECFARCAAAEDRAAGACSVAQCALLCPGPGPGGTI